jgi:hypothetical protein
VIGNPQPASPRRRLAWEIDAVADRFRGLSAARLSRAFPPYESRAAAGRELAQTLADAAAGVANRDDVEAPAARHLPTVGVFAVGEQIAVTGHDLVAELADVADDDLVWWGTERRRTRELIAETVDALRRLRLTL